MCNYFYTACGSFHPICHGALRPLWSLLSPVLINFQDLTRASIFLLTYIAMSPSPSPCPVAQRWHRPPTKSGPFHLPAAGWLWALRRPCAPGWLSGWRSYLLTSRLVFTIVWCYMQFASYLRVTRVLVWAHVPSLRLGLGKFLGRSRSSVLQIS